MARWLGCLSALMLVAAWGWSAEQPTAVGVGPKPAPTPVSWELDFKYVPPRRIAVEHAGSSQPQVYWYMLYTVTNNTDQTRYFYPTFELVTDDLRVIPTDVGISTVVFEAIKERHKITHPYLVAPSKAIGDLRVGEDYARESVAIWRADDIGTTGFTIFVAGLSGEARVVRNPSFKPDQPETRTITDAAGRQREVTVNPRYFTLRKTLELQYLLPASPAARGYVEPELRSARWIMR